jgi:hypothetical protein
MITKVFGPSISKPILILAFSALVACSSSEGNRRSSNENLAIRRIRTIGEMEVRFAAAHPKEGFACHLRELTTVEPPPEWSVTEHDLQVLRDFFQTGIAGGYRFDITKCQVDSHGLTSRYELTGKPMLPGQTGIRAFCSDESRTIWFDQTGSPTQCLVSRLPLPSAKQP